MNNTLPTQSNLDYGSTVERTYTSSHPKVLQYTEFFGTRANNFGIFDEYDKNFKPEKERAVVVGTQWHRFSAFMPWFLCQAAAQVSTNEKRHYVIQTAFEELGMRESTEIHPDMFWSAAQIDGATIKDQDRLKNETSVSGALDYLKETILTTHTDAEVLGLLLGLEIPAVENIDEIFRALSHSPEVKAKVAETKFFKIHRQIEIEHVRLTISNFLRFCKENHEEINFIEGFDKGLLFWKRFWNSLSDLVKTEKLGVSLK
jgi:hypothetical protein